MGDDEIEISRYELSFNGQPITFSDYQVIEADETFVAKLDNFRRFKRGMDSATDATLRFRMKIQGLSQILRKMKFRKRLPNTGISLVLGMKQLDTYWKRIRMLQEQLEKCRQFEKLLEAENATEWADHER